MNHKRLNKGITFFPALHGIITVLFEMFSNKIEEMILIIALIAYNR
jgi:hypothetical protein